MEFDFNKLEWTRKPQKYDIQDQKIIITTEPETDLWQRTYYGFRNDNVLNAKLNKKKNKENSQNKRKSLIKVNE